MKSSSKNSVQSNWSRAICRVYCHRMPDQMVVGARVVGCPCHVYHLPTCCKRPKERQRGLVNPSHPTDRYQDNWPAGACQSNWEVSMPKVKVEWINKARYESSSVS